MRVSVWRFVQAILIAYLASPAMAGASPAPDPSRLSILTYNVHALPWPLAGHRGADLATMATQLRALRARGAQPRVVALQEAFTDDAKAIGAAAGYRYVRFGPSAATPAPRLTGAADRSFGLSASFLAGERVGKQVDSGLAIFSDYPIVRVRQVVYPVCAGFDCLAAKGALAVWLAVPGFDRPVVVLDTHLNANGASGVSHARALYAYQRQLDVLDRFVEKTVPADMTLLVAGDFNVGRDTYRRDYFARWRNLRTGGLASPIIRCPRCTITNFSGVTESLSRGKDWLLYRARARLAAVPIGLAAPFGRDAAGRMLSDHIGISATYRLGDSQAGIRPIVLAAR